MTTSDLIFSLSIGTLSKSPESDSSGSTASDDINPARHPRAGPPLPRGPADQPEPGSDQEDSGDEAHELPAVHAEPAMSQANRPQSSLSSQRYRTPMTASLAISPPPAQRIPTTQPLPTFETPSAFAEPSPPSSVSYPPTTSPSFVGQFSGSSRGEMTTPTHLYPTHHQFRSQTPSHPVQYGPLRPASRLTLEHAVENVQAHMAAMSERLESLEALTSLSRSNVSYSPRAIASPGRGRESPTGRSPEWDIDDLGLWSLVLNPLSRGLDVLRDFSTVFTRNENRSPTSIIVRRLCLDVSFLVCVFAVVRAIWKRSGVRRREVRAALVVLWRAILGTKPRMMIDQGV